MSGMQDEVRKVDIASEGGFVDLGHQDPDVRIELADVVEDAEGVHVTKKLVQKLLVAEARVPRFRPSLSWYYYVLLDVGLVEVPSMADRDGRECDVVVVIAGCLDHFLNSGDLVFETIAE